MVFQMLLCGECYEKCLHDGLYAFKRERFHYATKGYAHIYLWHFYIRRLRMSESSEYSQQMVHVDAQAGCLWSDF
jgi:hypothetical protein